MVAPGEVVLRPLRADDELLYVGLYTDARAMRHLGPVIAPDAARRDSFLRLDARLAEEIAHMTPAELDAILGLLGKRKRKQAK